MHFLVPLVLYFFTFSLQAESFQSKVHSIDYSAKASEPHLIKMESGRVFFVERANKKLLKSFEESLKQGNLIKVQVDEKNNFQGAETLEVSAPDSTYAPYQKERFTPFEPTIVSGSGEARQIFKRMRRDYQNKSQCYNRAHIWAYEEYKHSGLKSWKYFLFFTSRYIRSYNYKWWFHVAPAVTVNGQGVRILDRRYTRRHLSIPSWTDIFVYSGRSCPIVKTYNDYRNHQNAEDCYLIPVSMYFWQPRDIEKRDRTGYEKTSFIDSEIDWSYWEAF